MSEGKFRPSRRAILSSAAIGGAVGAAGVIPASAQNSEAPAATPSVTPPSSAALAAEQEPPLPSSIYVTRSGSDYMVEAIKSTDIEYIATNPGSSFRGIHESLINHGGNRPELLTCLHEEIAVGMCHGYAKAAGKPMAALLHGPVGLTHASMAIYNAWCDRVPVVMLSGNSVSNTTRKAHVEWNHSAQHDGAMVRDITKWADQPSSLLGFAESLSRAYGVATTPPFGPVLVTADKGLQEAPAPETSGAVRVARPTPPAPDRNALREAARLLANAERPVIMVDQLVRSQQGMDNLVALAEALQAPVVDRLGRLNMPSRHPLNVPVMFTHSSRSAALTREADVILGLEVWDMWGSLNQYRDALNAQPSRLAAATAKIITISTNELHVEPNLQDFQRYNFADVAITADGEASLPLLIEEVRRAIRGGGSRRAARGRALAEALEADIQRDREEATHGWDANPVSVARICAELWAQIKHHDWVLASDTVFKSRWPQRLWNFDKQHQYIGGSGGQGMGYGGPAGLGCALAHRGSGRLVVNFLGDGDHLYCPQSLWTAAHHNIPLLTIVHNNRSYHQEVMHVQRMANRHARGVDTAHIGTIIDNPAIDLAKMAQSMGVWAEGPIADPAELGPALARAIAVVRGGAPALLDVVSQPR